jgi:site-specific DNA recombinase
VIYLAMMAPDLSLRLLSGDHPRELTSVKLLSLMPLPEAWDEQRRLLGMTS